MIKKIILFLIKAYQLAVSPDRGWRQCFFSPTCRFYPSCSEYAKQAIDRYGAARGGWKAIKRIGRCHPWHEGGYDPLA
jgi:hypothetical protein